ncbi:MAG: alanine racemase [bacterium]|nr:alanine racemase [bacterium]
MLRDTYLEIDLGAIRHNLAQYRAALPSDGALMAVVKADGYGHGAFEISRTAQEEGVEWIGTALVEEAVELRQQGIRLPILVLGPFSDQSLPYFEQYQLSATLYSLDAAKRLRDFAAKQHYRQPAHLKVDTGMGRLGLNASQLREFLSEDWSPLYLEGLESHLACADQGEDEATLDQIHRFWAAQEGVDAHFMPRWLHLANSAGTTEFNQDRGNLFRIGIGMYGQMPSEQLRFPPNLRQALSFKTRVAQLQNFEAHQPLSYGGTFVTQRPSQIAVIAAGYGDGYSRLLSNQAEVLIRGQRAPVVGRVCMDLTLVDVTDLPGVALDDEVVLIGRQGEEEILASELAQMMGTINYEVCCNISKRVPRIYRN